MISRKSENFILNKAKTTVDTLVSTRIFNAIQDEICHLQPIIEFLNNSYTYIFINK